AADEAVAEAAGLPEGQLQHLLGPGSEGDVAAGGRVCAPADDLLDPGPAGVEGNLERRQDPVAGSGAVAEQAQEQVLRADVVVVEAPGLLGGEDDHAPGRVGESFEHGVIVPGGRLRSSGNSAG